MTDSQRKQPDLESLVEQLAVADLADASIQDSTVNIIKAELDTLAQDLGTPPPDDRLEDASAFQRGLELVKAMGRDPSFRGKPDDDSQPLELESIRDYRLLAKLGEGGMGAVYKALHTKLDKVVALKILSASRMQDSAAVERFEREMKAVGKLEHPNIVRAMDAGEVDGTHYLVMELVDGLDLSTLVRRLGPLAPADACELIRQTAVGLQEADEHGMVHRDIKPSNLMLARDVRGKKPPTVKILDMGLALLDESHSAEQRELTSTGQMMGTFHYMAPEQGRDSHDVDIRADIYSLGATLYKLLCGEAPFPSSKYDTPVKLLMALASEPVPSIATNRDDLPAGLVAIVDRMLAKQPSDRFTTPQQVADALAAFTEDANLAALLEHAAETTETSPDDGSLAPTYDCAASASHDTEPTLDPSKTPQELQHDRDVLTADSPAASKPQPWWTIRRNQIIATATALGGGILLGIITLLFQTEDGTIVVEIDDPDGLIEVKVVGQDIVINDKQRQSEPITLQAGKHQLHVTRGGLSFKTGEFTLERDQRVVLNVTFSSGQVQVNQQDKGVIGQSEPASSDLPAFAIALDGSTSHAVAEDLGIEQSNQLTIEAWIQTASAIDKNSAVIVMLGGKKLGLQGDALGIDFPAAEPPRTFGLFPKQSLSAGVWQHIAGVWDGDRAMLFVDGQKLADHVYDAGLHQGSANLLRIGTFETAKNFHGQIRELRISKTPRYSDDFAPDATFATDEHTIALYRSDTDTGDVLKDHSGNGHDGKLVHGAKWVPVKRPRVEYEVAKSVLAAAANIRILTERPINGTRQFDLAALDDLPKFESHAFTILGINAGESQNLTDAHLEQIGHLESLDVLGAYGCQAITDIGVAKLRGLDIKRALNVGATAITNASIPIFAEMSSLESLYCDGNAIDDKNIAELSGLKNLKFLRLLHTKVSEDAIKRLHAAIPHCKIESPFGDFLPITNHAIEATGILKDKARIAEMPRNLSLDDPMTIEMTIVPRSHADQGESRLFWTLAGRLELKQYEDTLTWQFNNPGGQPSLEQVSLRDMPLSQPLHIAAVSTGKVLRLYVNGKLVGSRVLQYTLPTNRPPMILTGWGENGLYGPFDGTIDEIRISKTVRYDSDYHPFERFERDEDTLALYHCDEGSGETIKDHSGNGFDLQMLDGRWINLNETNSASVGASAAPFGILKLRHTIVGPEGAHFKADLAFTPDETSVAFRVSGKEVKGVMTIADVATGEIAKQFSPHDEGGHPIAFSSDGKLLATGGGHASVDTNLKLWDAKLLTKRQDLVGIRKGVADVEFSPDGGRLVSVGGDDRQPIIMWDIATGRILFTQGEDLTHVESVAFTPDGSKIACADGTGRVLIYDANKGDLLRELPKQTDNVSSVAFARDGRLATCGRRQFAQVWNCETGEPLFDLGRKETNTSIAFSPAGELIALGGSSGHLTIFDANTGQQLQRLEELHTNTRVAFSADGRLLATIGIDGVCKLWDVKTTPVSAEGR